MHKRFPTLCTLLVGASLFAGCSSDSGMLGSSLTTSSLNSANTVAQAPAPKIDPACIALTARIDALRRDGVSERVEKASVGKSTTVAIKRASLAQMTELDKANAEFQARCSTLGARPATAQIPAVSSTAVVATSSAPPVTGVKAATPAPSAVVAPVVAAQPVPKQ
jgi:hypothetical protein